jgi:hypothetical protein
MSAATDMFSEIIRKKEAEIELLQAMLAALMTDAQEAATYRAALLAIRAVYENAAFGFWRHRIAAIVNTALESVERERRKERPFGE